MALNIDILDFLDNEFTKTTLSPNSLSPSDTSSASSGISSLDSDELKKRSTPLISQDESDANSSTSELKDESDVTSSSFELKEEDVTFAEELAKADDVKIDVVEKTTEIQAEQFSEIIYEKPVEIIYNNRDALDLCSTMTDGNFKLQYAHLPENNLQMFFANRSQYYRLGAGGEKQEYLIEKCPCCDFTYPLINNPNASLTKSANPMTESIMKFLNSPEIIMMNLPTSVPITKRNTNMNGQQVGNSNNNNQLQYNSKTTLNNINYLDSYKTTKVNNYNNFTGNNNAVPTANTAYTNTAAIALYNLMTRSNSSFPSNPNNTLVNNTRFSNGSNSCDSFNNNNYNNMNGNSSQATSFRPY
ncbi:unnamed protein product [Diamesa tonsa]